MKKMFASLPKWVQDLVVDIAAVFFAGLGVVNFAQANNFAPGGINGVGIILQHLFNLWFGINIDIGIWNLLLNIPIIIFAWNYLGKSYLLRTLKTVISLSVMMDLVIKPYIPAYTGNTILAAIFGGAFMGVGLGIAFGQGTCTGGLDLIIMSIKTKRPHMSFGQITLVIDAIVIISAGIVFHDINSTFYGIILAVVMTKTIDAITTGSNAGKLALIICDDGESMGKAIGSGLKRGATIIAAQGAYSGADKLIVMCALNRQQLPDLRKIVKEQDERAFLIVQEYKDVFGTGFQSH